MLINFGTDLCLFLNAFLSLFSAENLVTGSQTFTPEQFKAVVCYSLLFVGIKMN